MNIRLNYNRSRETMGITNIGITNGYFFFFLTIERNISVKADDKFYKWDN